MGDNRWNRLREKLQSTEETESLGKFYSKEHALKELDRLKTLGDSVSGDVYKGVLDWVCGISGRTKYTAFLGYRKFKRRMKEPIDDPECEAFGDS